MNETLLFTVLVLCILGVLSAVILYFVAQKFKVVEDPRIGVVEGMLPGANCGGCGFPGCKGMADALVKNDDLSALYCPVGGAGTMQGIASYLGKAVADKGPEVAVIRCAGNCDNVPGPIFSTEPRPVPWKLPCMPVKLPAHSDAWGKAIA